ncbi:hypothetical protein N7G274_009975 [Stereocaulon virgatum]|uniref:Uncharacterized protein n=1 Tax=Stereocaulon virgatum TaxID=373712 RepID=A0ABR3ZWI1_9LECA
MTPRAGTVQADLRRLDRLEESSSDSKSLWCVDSDPLVRQMSVVGERDMHQPGRSRRNAVNKSPSWERFIARLPRLLAWLWTLDKAAREVVEIVNASSGVPDEKRPNMSQFLQFSR